MKFKVNFEINESEVKEILKHLLYVHLLNPDTLGIIKLLLENFIGAVFFIK